MINVHAAKGKTARLHARRSCSALRTKDVRSLPVPLNSETIARMCRQCAEWGRWARPGTALDIFLQAVTGTGLCYDLERYPWSDDNDEWTEEEATRAATLLRQGDYPPEEGNEEDENLRSDFEEARYVRDGVFEQWSSAAESVHQALTVIGRYPWLEPWARERLTRKAEYVEASRALAAHFSRPAALMAATAVFQAPDPEFPTEDPAFSVLGDVTTVRVHLQRLRRHWKRKFAANWHTTARHSLLDDWLERCIERTHKQRKAVRARAVELLTEWNVQAQIEADHRPERPEQLILARVPEGEDKERLSRSFQQALTRWDLEVLAAYTVAADWGRRTMLLRVPPAIGERLLSGGSALDCEPGHDGLPLPSEAPAADEPLTPGVLDDTPVAERRPITAEHVRALRAAGPNTEQLVIVFAPEDGVEVLPLHVIEQRCAAGWRGVFIAGASDLPASVIDPWGQRLVQSHGTDSAENSDRPWSRQHLPTQDPNFARHLGVAAGEAWLQAWLGSPRRRPADRDRILRCYSMARNIHDLRALEGDPDHHPRTIPSPVWNALLAADQLDLLPFQPENETEFRGGGIGVPLGVLPDVQIYTTNADPAVMRKGHSPYCSHSRDAGVTKYFDLLTAADLLRYNNFDWCSKCGGYAMRHLTNLQLDYYRVAHHLLSIAHRLRDGYSQPGPQEITTIRSQLMTLRSWGPVDHPCWRGGPEWRWQEIAGSLLIKVDRLASARPDESTGENVIQLRRPGEQH